MKIDRDKWYLTRGGKKVRVVCVDASEFMPIIGIDERGNIDTYRADGGYFSGGMDGESQADLVSEYVEPPKPREIWANVYSFGVGSAWLTKGEAEAASGGETAPVLFREVIA